MAIRGKKPEVICTLPSKVIEIYATFSKFVYVFFGLRKFSHLFFRQKLSPHRNVGKTKIFTIFDVYTKMHRFSR